MQEEKEHRQEISFHLFDALSSAGSAYVVISRGIGPCLPEFRASPWPLSPLHMRDWCSITRPHKTCLPPQQLVPLAPPCSFNYMWKASKPGSSATSFTCFSWIKCCHSSWNNRLDARSSWAHGLYWNLFSNWSFRNDRPDAMIPLPVLNCFLKRINGHTPCICLITLAPVVCLVTMISTSPILRVN